MDTKHKIVFYLFFIVIIIILCINMCKTRPNDSLDKALLELDSAQKHLDTALAKIDATRIVIDTMRNNFNKFQDQMNDIKKDVVQVNTNSTKNAKIFRSSMDTLKVRNQSVLDRLNVTHDSLPDIKIVY